MCDNVKYACIYLNFKKAVYASVIGAIIEFKKQ